MPNSITSRAICRACLLEAKDMSSIFDKEVFANKSAQICEIVKLCASVQISKGDGLPEQMCRRCLRELKRAFAFKKLCETSDDTMRDSMMPTLTKETYVEVESEDEEETVENDFSDDVELMDYTEYVVNIPDTPAVQSNRKYPAPCFLENQCEDFNKERKEIFFNTSLGKYLCQKCNITFTSLSDYRMHKKTEHTETSQTSSKEPEQRKHIARPPSNDKPVPKSGQGGHHKCTRCTNSFVTRTELKTHLLKHPRFKPFACYLCGRDFQTEPLLQMHMNLHSGEKPYKCEDCPKSFATSPGLNSHKRVHMKKLLTNHF